MLVDEAGHGTDEGRVDAVEQMESGAAQKLLLPPESAACSLIGAEVKAANSAGSGTDPGSARVVDDERRARDHGCQRCREIVRARRTSHRPDRWPAGS